MCVTSLEINKWNQEPPVIVSSSPGKGFNLELSDNADGVAEAQQKLEASGLLVREAIDTWVSGRDRIAVEAADPQDHLGVKHGESLQDHGICHVSWDHKQAETLGSLKPPWDMPIWSIGASKRKKQT